MSSDHENLPKDEGDAVPRFLESKPLRAKQAAPSQKKQWVVLALLSAFLIFLLLQTLVWGKKKLPTPVTKAKVPAVAVVTSVAAPLTPENDIFQTPELDKEDRSSPFTRAASSPSAPVQKTTALVLQGILSDAGGSIYAVINEKIVKKGERMADKVITTIQSDSVTLRSDSGEEMTLRMKTS